MVAYSFQRRFCDDVAELVKRQTIRGDRKRHARPGEPVQLYYAMRTKQCRKLVTTDPICTSVEPIGIHISLNRKPAMVTGAEFKEPAFVTPEFAIADGFEDPDDFTKYWFDAHGVGTHRMFLIKWTPADD